MQHIKKIIEKNLKNLSKEEREEFRNVILETFSTMTSNIEKRMEKFESKILSSVGSKNEAEDINILLIEKNDYYLYEDKFFPIVSLENEDELKDILMSDEKILKEVYLPFSPNELKKIENDVFYGEIKFENNVYNLKFKLEKNNNYKAMTKLLYETFALNNLKWKTVLNPYASKMYFLKIIDFDEELINIGVEKNKIIFSESSIKKYFEKDILLCWNIEIKPIVGESVVAPTKNSIHLEHLLTFSDNKNIYVCPADYYIYMVEKINNEQIVAITEDIKNIVWKVIDIKKIDEEKYKELKYPLFTNKLNFHFINQVRFEKEKKIRTFGELERVANSFEIFNKYFSLKSAKVIDFIEKIETYEVNDFINDEFRLKGQEKKLEIIVSCKKIDEYTIDILSFIISEIQLYFPEYKCVGVIE